MEHFPRESEDSEGETELHPKSSGLFKVDEKGRFVEKQEEEKRKMNMRDLVFQTAREMNGGKNSFSESVIKKKTKSGNVKGTVIAKEAPKVVTPTIATTNRPPSEVQKRQHIRELLQKQQALKAEAIAQQEEEKRYKQQIAIQRSARLRGEDSPSVSRKRSSPTLPM